MKYVKSTYISGLSPYSTKRKTIKKNANKFNSNPSMLMLPSVQERYFSLKEF